jgi:hypothetical protein
VIRRTAESFPTVDSPAQVFQSLAVFQGICTAGEYCGTGELAIAMGHKEIAEAKGTSRESAAAEARRAHNSIGQREACGGNTYWTRDREG